MRTAEFFASDESSRARFEREIVEWRKVFDWEHMVETIEALLAELRNNG
jgi:hypothetical protein